MAWTDLFSSDYGLMSLVVIVGVVVIGAVLGKIVSDKIKEDAQGK